MRCVIGPHWVPLEARSSVPTPEVLDVTGDSPIAAQEAVILESFKGHPVPSLDCDTVLNSGATPSQLLRMAGSTKLVVNFWTPTCGPCKPLLADLAAVARSHPADFTVIGVVKSADGELEPPGEWRLLRVKGLMAQYKVDFPTCVYTSNDMTRRWQAGGVPLTLLLSPDKGVERVAVGAESGARLLQDLSGRKTGTP